MKPDRSIQPCTSWPARTAGIVLGLAGLLLTAAAGRPAAAQPLTMHWAIEGVDRQALVFAPTSPFKDAKTPVLFAFHGHGGTMGTAALAMRFQSLWPEALVVYMQGLPTPSPVDPQGRHPGWQSNAGDLGDRDLKFFDAALASLKAKYPLDPRRIYAAGFSNGGYFSYLLWTARAGTFAGFASIAGALRTGMQLTVAKPLLQVIGQQDAIVPVASQMRAVAAAQAVDGATTGGQACGQGCTLYPSSKGAPVEMIVHAGGHTVPPGAAAKIVDFLKAQALHP